MLVNQLLYSLLFLLLPSWHWLTIELILPFRFGVDLIVVTVAIHRHNRNALSNKCKSRYRSCRRHTKFKRSITTYPRKSRRCHNKSRQANIHLNSWGSLPDSPPHWYDLLQCFRRPPRVCTREHAFDILWAETCWAQTVHDFISGHNPRLLMVAVNLSFLPSSSNTDEGVVSPHLTKVLISSIDSPHCLSSSVLCSHIINDSGASVCLSPHRSDFITYHASTMKIKDLSSSNQVAGEGIVRWTMQNAHGYPVDVDLLGYHIPKAEVRLLSPQVLLNTFGGEGIINGTGIDFALSDGNKFSSKYCPRSNLPLIPLALRDSRNF